jgi:hypothetical protein
MRTKSWVSVCAGVVLALCLAACKKNEPAAANPPAESVPASAAPSAAAVRITDVQVGKALGADKKVSQAADAFAPKDTIFASVTTEGTAPSATIRALWKFQDGQTVKDDSRTISPTGTAVTEFSIQKPDGWPKGNYTVEITVDGGPVSTKSFRVE